MVTKSRRSPSKQVKDESLQTLHVIRRYCPDVERQVRALLLVLSGRSGPTQQQTGLGHHAK